MKGIDPTGPSIIYLMTHDGFRAIKVGIGAASEVRVSSHAKYGWTLHAKWRVPTGKTAFAVEREILRWWREDLGAPIAVDPRDMPQYGATETAPLVFVDPDETSDVIGRLIRVLSRDSADG